MWVWPDPLLDLPVPAAGDAIGTGMHLADVSCHSILKYPYFGWHMTVAVTQELCTQE